MRAQLYWCPSSMADKLHKYQGFYGRLHELRDLAKQKYEHWKDEHPKGIRGMAMNVLKTDPHSRGPPPTEGESIDDFPHIYRRKTRAELVRISAAVMGIEFSYAAETAFVSPTLLQIGVRHEHMTMVWGLSPLLGFFVTPVLGSLSDGCGFRMGRRRPFILFLSLGVLIGLLLVPNGEDLGHALGDFYPSRDLNSTMPIPSKNLVTSKAYNGSNAVLSDSQFQHPWGVFFTILGTVLLDFDADSCQSPARAYLLDVSLPEDHARGLSTFTIMAGLGGFFGYALGGVNWDATLIGQYLGGHVRAVFTFITVLFIICVLCTITSFKEIPLHLLQREKDKHNRKLLEKHDLETIRISSMEGASYGATNPTEKTEIYRRSVEETQLNEKIRTETDHWPKDQEEPEIPTLKEYLLSILIMPKSMRMVCLTNLFCWMSHVCYSLYFTDFVGEAVFNGDPSAPIHSEAYERYQEGVRFGCWGMSMYSLSCSCYSLIIEALIKRFRAKRVYIGGLLFYSLGMLLMALTKGKVGVILFSWTAGVMYSTLFTLPYLLIAHYHASGVFELTKDGEVKVETRLRGLGTDVGIVSSMVFLAQFILALCMGSIVSWMGSTTAVVAVASFLAFCGALSATKILYLDL